MEHHTSFLPPYVSTQTSARWLSGLLLLTATLASVSAGLEGSEIFTVAKSGGAAAVDPETQWAYNRTRNILYVARLVPLIAVTAFFIVWLHRQRINVRAFGCRGFRFTRIWTVIGFLIPVVNSYRPYQVVSEVWRASDPRSMEPSSEWKRLPLHRLVPSWWGALLVAAGLEILAMFLAFGAGESFSHLATARGIAAVACLTTAAASVLAFLLVSQLERMQQTKWAILNHETEVLSGFSPARSTTPIPAGVVTANSV
jgi:hypothetical protein